MYIYIYIIIILTEIQIQEQYDFHLFIQFRIAVIPWLYIVFRVPARITTSRLFEITCEKKSMCYKKKCNINTTKSESDVIV